MATSSISAPVETAPVRSTSAIQTWRRVAALFGVGLLAALLPFLLLSRDFFWLNIITYTYLFAGLAVAWNIIAESRRMQRPAAQLG